MSRDSTPKNKFGCLPLHYAVCKDDESLDVIVALVEVRNHSENKPTIMDGCHCILRAVAMQTLALFNIL
jgi:hypothetical protein